MSTQQHVAACAELMARRLEDPLLDLRRFTALHDNDKGPLLQQLAQAVEEFSGGVWTVRGAGAALFPWPSTPTQALYCAVCPAATANGILTEVGPNVTLYTLSPYQKGGLAIRRPAEPMGVANYHDRFKDHHRWTGWWHKWRRRRKSR